MKMIIRLIRKIKKKVRLYYYKVFCHNIQIGDNVNFRNRLILNCSSSGRISIGNGVFFNNGCSINAKDSITIGDNCIFGEDVKIYDHNHRFDTVNRLIKEQGYSCKPVVIGENCWVGSNTIILAGSSIGNNAVIAAGCVIKGEIPANVVVKTGGDLKTEPIIYRGGEKVYEQK